MRDENEHRWTLPVFGRLWFLYKTHDVHFAFVGRTDSENPILPIRISFTIKAQFPDNDEIDNG